MSDITGTLFAIKRYAIHDGPNIRTTVFLKGCPLSCSWCHNPEGIPSGIHLVSNSQKCIECDACIDTCPYQALDRENGQILRDPEKCHNCEDCVDICPALVHETTGWATHVDQVMQEILKDEAFFHETQGGVTFSGGEPLHQADFLLALLVASGKAGLHRTVDSSAYAATETLLKINSHTDLWLLDLKHMDAGTHQKHTGVSNTLILKNIRELCQIGAELRIRVPLIPGFNDRPVDLLEMATFVSNLPGNPPVDILPYHETAISKYRKLGLDYAPVTKNNPDLKPEQALRILQDHGISVQIGG